MSTHLVKTNMADLPNDIEKVAKKIRPNAFAAVVNIKGSPDVSLDDAKLAVGGICARLPREARVVWGCAADEGMPHGAMEIRFSVAYKEEAKHGSAGKRRRKFKMF